MESPKGNAHNAVDNWVRNFTAWKGKPAHNTLTEVTEGGTTYLRGDYRFRLNDEKTALLDTLEHRLQRFQGGLWYRVGYHVCNHDEADSRKHACMWQSTREHGDIPDDVPTIT